jgi:protein phosphatase
LSATFGADAHGDRDYQEDAWLVAEREGAVLCVACDGMGASRTGREASDLVVDFVKRAFDEGASGETLARAIVEANRELFERSEDAKQSGDASKSYWIGMGTTVELACFERGRAFIAHVGDGRVMRYRNGALESLTVEHSLINDYRRFVPDITEEQLAELPKNVITRAIGMQREIVVDRHGCDARPGDVFVICTDGLTSYASDAAIAEVLSRSLGAEKTVEALIALALQSREDNDNLAVAVHVVGDD